MNLRDHLQAIRDEHGALNAELVADIAADDDHPLHPTIYDCAPPDAARRYYVARAAHLLRVVKLPNVEGRPADLRAFMAVKGSESHRADYVPAEEAMADEFTRTLVLRNMEREWKTLKRRYDHMREFAAMVANDLNGESA